MAPVTLRPGPAPLVSTDSRPVDRAPQVAGDYTVQAGDTLTSISRMMLQAGGISASPAAIARAVQELKAANPRLTTPARDGGNKIFPGDAIHFPKTEQWQPRASTGPRSVAPEETAVAAAQMTEVARLADQKNAGVKASLVQQLNAVSGYAAAHPLSEGQLERVGQLLAETEREAPELLASAEAQALIALLPARPGVADPLQGLSEPSFPGANASDAELAQYEADAHKYIAELGAQAGMPAQAISAQAATAGRPPSAVGPSPGPSSFQPQYQAAGSIEDRALAGLSALKEPADPGPNASEADLAKYQRDLGKYNRMFEMYSKIMANAHEMKKALIANFPR